MMLSANLHQIILDSVGDYEVQKNYREGSKRTGVWMIKSLNTQNIYFVKTYTRKTRFHPEVYAYKYWISILYPFAPQLISYFEGDVSGIIITALDGTTMKDKDLTVKQEMDAYYKAGELTRKLHSIQGSYFGRPDMYGNPIEIHYDTNVVNYMRKVLEDLKMTGNNKGCFNDYENHLCEWAINHIDYFRGVKPVPVSWDSSPYNWIVNKEGKFSGMIDFENMLYGVPTDHFTILFERYFPNSPHGKEAFFRGYGFIGDLHFNTQIKISCIKMGLADVIWGWDHRVERIYHLGKRILENIDEYSNVEFFSNIKK